MASFTSRPRFRARSPRPSFGLKGALRSRFVSAQRLAQRALSHLNPKRPLHLVDISGPGLSAMGADGRLVSDAEYDIAQAWSRAIYEQLPEIDGIYFRARHAQHRLSLAIFERPDPPTFTTNLEGTLADPRLRRVVAELLDEYNFGTDLQ